jgi:hypothetical protein
LIANVRTAQPGSNSSSDEPAVADVIAAIDTTVHPNLKLGEKSIVTSARIDGVKQILDEATGVRVAATQTLDGWNIYAWDDWYDYPKSYWLPENKKGVDRGEPHRSSRCLFVDPTMAVEHDRGCHVGSERRQGVGQACCGCAVGG